MASPRCRWQRKRQAAAGWELGLRHSKGSCVFSLITFNSNHRTWWRRWPGCTRQWQPKPRRPRRPSHPAHWRLKILDPSWCYYTDLSLKQQVFVPKVFFIFLQIIFLIFLTGYCCIFTSLHVENQFVCLFICHHFQILNRGSSYHPRIMSDPTLSTRGWCQVSSGDNNGTHKYKDIQNFMLDIIWW